MGEISIDNLYQILLNAKKLSEETINNTKYSVSTDDQDCYPKWIILDKGNSSDFFSTLEKLGSVFPWIKFQKKQRSLLLLTDVKSNYKLTQLAGLTVIQNLLIENGIKCYAEVSWHG